MRKRWTRRRKQQLFGMTMIVPAALLLCITIVTPLFRSIYASFLDDSLLSEDHAWNGFQNYITLLSSSEFYHSLRVTLLYVICVVGIELILGTILALLLHSQIRFRSFFRSIMLIPWAIPTIVSAVIFLVIYNGDYGVLNQILMTTGISDHKLNALNDLTLALPAVMGVAIWRQTPLMAIMILAGLQNIPASLYEAATIDGAGARSSFFHITLPSLKPVLANVALLMTVNNFQMFTLFYTLTNGGPVGATKSLAILTYETAFEQYDLGLGAAIGVIWMILLLLFSIPLYRMAHASREG
ncbi:multiple sugar transport system permease protein [Paenibacillus shirakamiensis]|uniref:Multiple sugar transport system permease protein n=1 Tax=Paenibacillus shirakamiensis TaxID=1265935 RepID=A0ABS4JFZ9_9BACL|nr:sugar ABC transporter permease [Paenibacillus shirakamiensis]MBP2000632.1 multiple sugar transport system permease protein [Paenibacillus shirakamiensis]